MRANIDSFLVIMEFHISGTRPVTRSFVLDQLIESSPLPTIVILVIWETSYCSIRHVRTNVHNHCATRNARHDILWNNLVTGSLFDRFSRQKQTQQSFEILVQHKAYEVLYWSHNWNKNLPSSTGCGRGLGLTVTRIRTTMWTTEKRDTRKKGGRQASAAHGPQPGVGGILCQWILKLYCLRLDEIRSHRLTASGSGWQFDQEISPKCGYGDEVVVASTWIAVEKSCW